MGQNMNLQIANIHKKFSTFFTLKTKFFRMNSFMSSQMGPPGKNFSTCRALDIFSSVITCMHYGVLF